ncbi:MAG: hypothetical protein ACE5DW_02160 [Thermodesulfobacteriota bacterium]
MISSRIKAGRSVISYAGILLCIIIFSAAAAIAGGPVDVSVDISPELKTGTQPDQVVFIFAKAVRGPKAPLAAVKVRVSDLPVTVRLDDSKALMPMLRISNFDEVVLSARISKSGGAMKQSGDLEGQSPPVKTDGAGKPVELTIDHIVK